MKTIGFGRTAEFVELDDARVMKIFNDWIPNEVAAQEYENHRRINGRFKDMPIAYELKTVEGKNAIVYQRIDGIPLSQYMKENPRKIGAVLSGFSSLHGSINRISGLEGLRDGGFIAHSIEKSAALSIAEKSTVLRFLKATSGDKVCHGDYHPENVMVDKENRLWVIDWLTAFRGNPLFDVARTYYLLRYGQPPRERNLVELITEKLFQLISPRRYLIDRIGYSKVKKLFLPYLFIVLVLRLDDGITEETAILEKKIRKYKGKALHGMESLLAAI